MNNDYPLLIRQHGLPPIPTRNQVCGVNITFQGLTVNTSQYGSLPWFEPAIGALSLPEDRLAVYNAKKSMEDTHCIIEFSNTLTSPYPEPGQPYESMNLIVGEPNPTGFRQFVEEIIMNGFIPLVVFDGDDGDNPDGGYPNALRQLPILVKLLDGLNEYILYGRLWDGVFYGSSPDNIQAFGQAFRQLLPNGYLAIEHNTGHIPVGGGQSDYQPPSGRMIDYDVVMSEFDYSNSVPPSDNIWQVVLRMIGPDWIKPADAPDYMTNSYASQHFYLTVPSPRGPYFYCAFEWEGIFYWVRGQSTSEQEASRRTYLRGCGCKYTG